MARPALHRQPWEFIRDRWGRSSVDAYRESGLVHFGNSIARSVFLPHNSDSDRSSVSEETIFKTRHNSHQHFLSRDLHPNIFLGNSLHSGLRLQPRRSSCRRGPVDYSIPISVRQSIRRHTVAPDTSNIRLHIRNSCTGRTLDQV